MIKFNICSNCSNEIQDCWNFKNYKEDEIYLCKNCLVKAILELMPIKFDKKEILDILKYSFNILDINDKRRNNNSNINKFFDWIQPFLESK